MKTISIFFASLAVLFACLSITSQAVDNREDVQKTTADPAQYTPTWVRPEIEPFEIPPFQGERYQDRVPDTLELADMAKLALNGLTGPLDYERRNELYFVVSWLRNPACMYHDMSSGCRAKFMGPLVLNRIISGSDDYIDIEKELIEIYLKMMDEQGRYHQPITGHPWHRHCWDGAIPWEPGGGTITRQQALELAEDDPPYGGGNMLSVTSRLIEAFILYSIRDRDDPRWAEFADKMAASAMASFVDKGEWGYFGSPNNQPKGFGAADGWTPQALSQYYRATGNERAKEVARKHLAFLKDHAEYFKPDGAFVGDKEFFPGMYEYGGHFHAHTNILLAMVEYTLATGDQRFAEFVKDSYEWAKSKKAYSSELTGFFPEFITPTHPNSEGCPVADMVALAVLMSRGGMADYWDDADRWIRNYFAEIQLSERNGEELERFSKTFPLEPVPYNATDDRVTERNIGAFAGWPAPNDWVEKIGIQHCCTGNCARAIYYAWESILRHKDDSLRVNLLLNRASPWADVYSYVPYEGRVDIKAKTELKSLVVRMPEWIDSESAEVECEVNKKPREFDWNGRYIQIGEVSARDKIAITFPIMEKMVTDTMASRKYTLRIKGNTVVSISPEGKRSPLYQRQRYLENKVRWRDAERFVSDERIVW